MDEKKRFYQKKWFLWLWLIVFPPVGIILLWTVHKTMKKGTKILLSVVFALWFIILMVATNGDSSETPTGTEQNEDISSTEGAEEDMTTESETETVAHRDGMYGVSDKDIDSLGIDSDLTVSKVPNDVTGNWRISVINKSMNFEEYALSYYKKYFTDDKEIHAIVNFAYNTTTKIQVIGDTLYLTVYEYVEDEEHDAKKLFSGMLYSEYTVYTDNGDIDKREVGPTNPNANSDVDATPENFLSDVKTILEDDESVIDVTLENMDLCVYIDLNVIDTPMELEKYAVVKDISVTDDILTLTGYDDLWETITVDFGDVGKIVNKKADMETTSYGRYFVGNPVLE